MAGLTAVRDYIRNSVGAGVNGAAYVIKRLFDDATISSGTTAADTDPNTTINGTFSADETTLGYPGPIKYVVTDAGTGSVREHTSKSTGIVGAWRAADVPRVWAMFADGVVPGASTELAVTTNGTNLVISVAAGCYLIDMGDYALFYSWPAVRTVTATAANPTQGRIDTVVLRAYPPGLEQEGRIDLVLLAGTPSGSPAAPGLTQSLATYWEVALANITVDAAVTSLAVGKVTDRRVFSPAMPSGLVSGDTLYVASTGKLARLTKGTDGQYMKQVSGVPSWDTFTASDVSDFDTQVRLSRLDQMAAPTASVSLNSQKITNLATPTLDTDATTKLYVDGIAQGLDVKASVRVASTANVTVSNPGTAVFDGITLAANDRILLKDQSTASQNGIYVFTNSASALTRALDANSSADVTTGMYTWVAEGTANADQGYILTTNDPIVLDTTGLTFTQFSGAGQVTAGNGLSKTGNTLAIDTAITVDKTTVQTLTNKTLTSPTLTTPALGTPASGVLTNATGLPIGTGVSGLGANVATFLTTPTSAALRLALTDETGTGAAVFATSPTIDAPTITGVGTIAANALTATSAATGLTVLHSATIGTDASDTLTLNGNLTVGGFFDISNYLVTRYAADGNTTIPTATTTYVTAGSITFTLPTGTWTVRAVGGVNLTNSGPANVQVQMVIDGTAETAESRGATTSEWRQISTDSTKVGVASGSRTVSLEYKGTSGTTTGQGWWLSVNAVRTA